MTRTILVDDKSMHIEGYKHIVSMTEMGISIDCGKKHLKISGQKIKIEILNSMELNIYGLIDKIEWIKV